ncbi:MAG: AAA family ATPase [Victivallaceae bacterium]
MSFVQAGKTAPAKALTSAVGAIFNRIQITPGLRPADIPGSSIYNPCDAARSGSR